MMIYDFIMSCLEELSDLLQSVTLRNFFAPVSSESPVTIWDFFAGCLGGGIVFDALWERWKK